MIPTSESAIDIRREARVSDVSASVVDGDTQLIRLPSDIFRKLIYCVSSC